MATVDITKAKKSVEFYAGLVAPEIINYILERLEKYLPDIDSIERREIDAKRIDAKVLVEDWRTLVSIREAIWEMVLNEKDKHKINLLMKVYSIINNEANDVLDMAKNRHTEAETLERYGLMLHTLQFKDLLYVLIPLAIIVLYETRRA